VSWKPTHHTLIPARKRRADLSSPVRQSAPTVGSRPDQSGDHHGLWLRLSFYRGERHEDWQLQDPAGQPIEVARGGRDQFDARVRQLLTELVPAPKLGCSKVQHARPGTAPARQN
jgi:hypothetical protein